MPEGGFADQRRHSAGAVSGRRSRRRRCEVRGRSPAPQDSVDEIVPASPRPGDTGAEARRGESLRPGRKAFTEAKRGKTAISWQLCSHTMIPKVIHRTWRSADIPAAALPWTRTWGDRNPDFDIRFYDDAACAAFVAREMPEYLSVYHRLPRPVQRADFFRYLVVYRFGGVYVDIDMECLRPFDRFLDIAGLMLSVEEKLTPTRQLELGYRAPWQLANCVFAAEAGHWFLARLIERIADSQVGCVVTAEPTDGDVLDSTGPRLLTRLYFELTLAERSDIGVVAQIYWMPPTWYPNRWPVNLNMYARHHFMGSWRSGANDSVALHRRIIERGRLPSPWPQRMAARVGSWPA